MICAEAQRRLVAYIHKQLAQGRDVELTDGNQIRDYLDVAHAGEVIAHVALGETTGPLNICSGAPISIREIAENIADKYQSRDLLKFGSRSGNLVEPAFAVGLPNHCVNTQHLCEPSSDLATMWSKPHGSV